MVLKPTFRTESEFLLKAVKIKKEEHEHYFIVETSFCLL